MKKFRNYLNEAAPPTPPPPGGLPGGDLGGLGGPPAAGGGMPPPMPPMGGGGGGLGLGGPPMGGLGGPDPMMGGGMGGPMGGGQQPQKSYTQLKPVDVWTAIERILAGKKVDTYKEKETGQDKANMVNNNMAPSMQQQPPGMPMPMPMPGMPPSGLPGL